MAENRKEIEYISLQDQQQFAAKVQQLLAEKPSQAAYVHSYGCQANVAEGEKIKGVLSQMGYGFTEDILSQNQTGQMDKQGGRGYWSDR